MDLTYSLTTRMENLVNKLEKRSRSLVGSYEQIAHIMADTLSGTPLKQDLRGYYSWDWTFQGVSIRICYKFNPSQGHIHIVYFGTRENFYEQVKRYLG